ncbi:hypothetical protein BGZ76_008759 [Entomortierella beljakovae]|nr:hypothetical protein BGZ76_008759 [Entomortierella beljakovae]
MKFILFRHGHSLANQESRIVSSIENGCKTTGGPEGTGFGLSQKGKQEVAQSARSLSKHILESSQFSQEVRIQILTSPFQRTCQTADIIDRELRSAIEEYNQSLTGSNQEQSAAITVQGEGPEQIKDLRERFFGEFEMKMPSDDLYAAVWREDGFNPFHQLFGVESVVEVTKRVTGVIRDLEKNEKENRDKSTLGIYPESWVIVVSHGDSLQILQTAMRGWSGDRHRQLDHLDTANWRQVQWCEDLANAH